MKCDCQVYASDVHYLLEELDRLEAELREQRIDPT
jgi:hypothetical protein